MDTWAGGLNGSVLVSKITIKNLVPSVLFLSLVEEKPHLLYWCLLALFQLAWGSLTSVIWALCTGAHADQILPAIYCLPFIDLFGLYSFFIRLRSLCASSLHDRVAQSISHLVQTDMARTYNTAAPFVITTEWGGKCQIVHNHNRCCGS